MLTITPTTQYDMTFRANQQGSAQERNISDVYRELSNLSLHEEEKIQPKIISESSKKCKNLLKTYCRGIKKKLPAAGKIIGGLCIGLPLFILCGLIKGLINLCGEAIDYCIWHKDDLADLWFIPAAIVIAGAAFFINNKLKNATKESDKNAVELYTTRQDAVNKADSLETLINQGTISYENYAEQMKEQINTYDVASHALILHKNGVENNAIGSTYPKTTDLNALAGDYTHETNGNIIYLGKSGPIEISSQSCRGIHEMTDSLTQRMLSHQQQAEESEEVNE